jgi:hypothetical protein
MCVTISFTASRYLTPLSRENAICYFMQVCVCVCVWFPITPPNESCYDTILLCVGVGACDFKYICTCTHTHTHTHRHMYIYVHMYICMYICIYVYICMCVCLCLCVHICMCVCVYIPLFSLSLYDETVTGAVMTKP